MTTTYVSKSDAQTAWARDECRKVAAEIEALADYPADADLVATRARLLAAADEMQERLDRSATHFVYVLDEHRDTEPRYRGAPLAVHRSWPPHPPGSDVEPIEHTHPKGSQ